jgi:hypothetical protein
MTAAMTNAIQKVAKALAELSDAEWTQIKCDEDPAACRSARDSRSVPRASRSEGGTMTESVVSSRHVSVFRNRHGIRRCCQCDRLLPEGARVDAKYCSARCRHARWHRRKRTGRVMAQGRKCEACRKRIALGMRADSRYCSARCRQVAYRRRKVAVQQLPQKAHQRIIREQLAAESAESVAADIGRAEVRPIALAEAKALIEVYEYLGTMPAVGRFAFGIFFDARCGGAVVYGDEYAENLGVWDRYGYRGKIIALLRGACAHWAHPHAASKLIRRSMDLLPEHYKVVTATVDQAAGEFGTIYQACGFDYVGAMTAGSRALIRIDGRTLSERQAGRLAGTRGARALAKLGFDAQPVPRRGRYFAFRGPRRERERYRDAIAHLIKPYPKREPIGAGAGLKPPGGRR